MLVGDDNKENFFLPPLEGISRYRIIRFQRFNRLIENPEPKYYYRVECKKRFLFIFPYWEAVQYTTSEKEALEWIRITCSTKKKPLEEVVWSGASK